MDITVSLILLSVLLLFIIIITGLEYAYLSANPLTIELKRKQGKRAGRILGNFFDTPEIFWRATVISFYILLVCFCFVFAQMMGQVYNKWHFNGFLHRHFYLQMVIDFLLITLILLFAAGVVAKRNFETYAEGKLNTWAYLLSFVSWLIRPIARFFIGLSEFILKYLFNVNINRKEAIFSRISAGHFLKHAVQGHEDFDEDNKEFFDKAMQLTKVKIRKCMTPRNEIIALDINQSVKDLKNLFVETKLSRIVIYEGSMDTILGYALYADMYHEPKNIKEILHPIPTVPESMNSMDLIHLFTKDKKSMAWVVDEFGGTAGFVTIENILEEIFGDISDEYESEQFTEKQISKREYIFSGRLELKYLNAKYDLDIVKNGSETLSGYIIAQYEAIPNQQEKIIIDHFQFEILRVSDTRIEIVKIKVLPN